MFKHASQQRVFGVVILLLLVALVAFFASQNRTQSQPIATKTADTQAPPPATTTPTPVPPTATEAATVVVTDSIAADGVVTETQPVSPLSPLATPTLSETLAAPAIASIPIYTFEIVNSYPHDPAAFTQGLVYTNGILYEGTGLNGRSSLRMVDLQSGSVKQQVDLSQEYFGEGITLVGNRIIQLTWQNQRGFVWEVGESFKPIKDYSYTTEGWGITHDQSQLIMSDGSDTLYFWDIALLTNDATQPSERKRLPVRANGEPVLRLNELEYVEGEIFANIWQTDQIARIDPTTGNVIGWIDLTGLLKPAERAGADVLNGIAYDDAGDHLFVTGKLWPKLFEIKLVAGSR